MCVGVANGAGQQGIVAYVNLGSYYLIGLPLGILLGYVFNLQVEVSFIIAQIMCEHDSVWFDSVG